MIDIKSDTSVTPSVLVSEKNLFDKQQALEAWIRKFVFSFKSGKLKEILQVSKFAKAVGTLTTSNVKETGLTVFIWSVTYADYKYLLSKRKQIRYRIQQLDADAKILCFCSPDKSLQYAVVIETGKEAFIDRGVK